MPDPAALLENALHTLNAHAITNLLLCVMVTVFVIGSVRLARLGAGNVTSFTPNLLTGLGIFGTFVGIVIALLGFDPGAIDTSIVTLLAGLKTAFISSLAGMGLALVFRSIQVWILDARGADVQAGSDPARQIISALHDQNRQLESFQISVSEAAAVQLVKTLETVTKNFNQAIEVQMGGALTQFADATHQLVAWQEQYRQQLQQMGQQNASSIEAIAYARDAMEEVSSNAHRVHETTQALAEVLIACRRDIDALRRGLTVVPVRSEAMSAGGGTDAQRAREALG